eukprot:10298209-Prorocentrum_lima.AAC.1
MDWHSSSSPKSASSESVSMSGFMISNRSTVDWKMMPTVSKRRIVPLVLQEEVSKQEELMLGTCLVNGHPSL